MENSTYISCNNIPWQASSACLILNFKDELQAAIQKPDDNHETGPKKLTEEAVYMIYVTLVFVGLALLGTSLTVCELFIKSNEKNSDSFRKGKNKNTNKITRKVLKEQKVSGSHDYLEDCKSFLKCFCMVSNGTKILSTSLTEGQIGCFHGMRFLSNIAIIGLHSFMMIIAVLRNSSELKYLLGFRLFYLAMNTGMFAVDVFFVISGFLNAETFFHKHSRSNGNISWFYFYFKRFVRLTPVYMVVLGFNATLISYTGTGIIWPAYDTNPLCQKDWWRHLLYINNFEESAQECLLWCWYLAADMQFYIISPLFMISLLRWPRLGYALILVCVTGSGITSFVLTHQHNLVDCVSQFEFQIDDFKNFINKIWEYFDVRHVKPYTRISSYLVAILLAHYLHKTNFNKNKAKNSAMTLSCGWIVTAVCLWLSFFSLYKRQEILMVTAVYNGEKNLLFSCGISWVIYLCVTGQSDFLNRCLSWKFFLPLSRLSYCAYLIHPLVLARLLLQAKDFMDFSYISMTWQYLYVCVFTYMISFFASMIFEMPVLNLLDRFDKKKVKKNSGATHLD